MTRKPVLEGGCQCGRVRYALYAAPEGSFCHCRMCQRATGAPFAALTCVPKPDFAWISREPALFDSSTVATRGFCRDCGTPLSFTYRNGPNTNVMVGTLDQPEQANVTTHFGVESRLDWLKMCDGLPERMTGGDPAAASRMAGMISHQTERDA
jgi:hypothetical protein